MKKLFKYIIVLILISTSFNLSASNFGKSLLLPGLGERSLGLESQSKNFMIAEASIWLSFFILGDFSSSYKTDYRNYAVMHAGVNWEDKNDLYAANVGNYESMEAYNVRMSQIANWDLIYTDDSYEWDWNGDNIKRNTYDSWRNKSSSYADLQEFAIAGFVLNRIISGFNVLINERKTFITSDIIRNDNHSATFKISYHF